jgi:rhodanese-related sulfurtransferase
MAKGIKLGPILTVLIFAVIIYLVYSYFNSPIHAEPSLRISVGEARSRRFGFIVDVRSPKERELLGYYPNSVPISMERLSKEVPLDISNKNMWILVYSNGDNRAATAAEILYRMGYPNVRYIKETYYSLMPGASY